MTTASDTAQLIDARTRRRRIVIGAAVLLVAAAIAVDTTVVHIGSDRDTREAGFSQEAFGTAEFPKIQAWVREKAVDAPVLAEAIAADKDAAIAKYGTPSGTAAVFPVKFTGVVGEGKSGIFKVAVDGMPDTVGIRVQTGPAINGTDLRDVTGQIQFGQFTNQIEFQNAGAGINNVVKTEVLGGLDRDTLTGKTVTVIGAFRLVNPKNWMVTPVGLAVE